MEEDLGIDDCMSAYAMYFFDAVAAGVTVNPPSTVEGEAFSKLDILLHYNIGKLTLTAPLTVHNILLYSLRISQRFPHYVSMCS
jgi:hypothetical protein